MNGGRQMEVHYINTGFPYTVTESFMDLFEGLTYAQTDFAFAEALHMQGSPYWSTVHSNSYKYGYSGLGSNSYYNFDHVYEVNDLTPRLYGSRRQWESQAPLSDMNIPHVVQNGNTASDTSVSSNADECVRPLHAVNNQQAIWQDNIDPDNMSYEELLDLGEAVGTQSRGLSQERISSLPVSKYKCGFFSRKKCRGERCVICQMDYKRGDRQMTLPCKHAYHSACVSKWLGINKACPVCFAEVHPTEPKKQ